MRAHAALSVAVVLALLVSGLLALAVPARAAPTTAASPHPMATDSITATNQFGSARSDFYVGYGSGVVYFDAFDPSDTQATVTITDTNATRDSIASPAFSYVASFASSAFNESWTYGVGYLIPLTLQYGGNWTLSISGTNGGVSNWTFYVHTYLPSVHTTQSGYLPGHVGEGMFNVYKYANSAPYSGTTVKVFAQYLTTGSTWSVLPGSPYSFLDVAQGTFNFTVPLTASVTGEIEFTIFANTTTGNSESNFDSVAVGNMSAPSIEVGTCPNGCFTTAFTDGATVYVAISEEIVSFFGNSPAANINLALSFASGALPATPPGVPTTLATNASGGASFVFLASSSVFSTTQADELTVTASDPANPSLPTSSTHVFFSVSTTGPVTPHVQVTFSALQYYGGDTAVVNWALGGLNATVTSGWTVSQWYVYDLAGGSTLAWGTINSTQTQGQVSFAIPVSYGGTIEAFVTAYNASAEIAGAGTTEVTAPTILLNPSEPYYLPGDTVTVQVSPEGSVFSSTTLYESVVESSGYQLSSGVLSGNTITINVPTTGAPSDITVSVAAQSATLGIVATNSIDLSESSGYVLYAGIQTKSNYADGSYQPGQTVQISYNLVTIGTQTLPKSFYIYVFPGSAFFFGSYGSVVSESTSASGSVSYTIPSAVQSGAQSFEVVVTSGICGLSCGAASTFSMLVEPNPSVLGYQLGAGSGVTVGWVILLVLVLLVGIVAYVWFRRAGGRGGKPSAVKPYATPQSGSSSTSSDTSSSWKESGSSGGGSSSPPPMPGSPPPSS